MHDTVLGGTPPPSRNRFEQHALRTAVLISTVLMLMALAAAELLLRHWGLGTPILYETHPDYGYRPRPNQRANRLDGAIVEINNLGLRSSTDWDGQVENKVLFLGNSVTYGGSYVSNSDLFAVLAVPNQNGWIGGSAGVNAWGVENIYGLIVRHEFRPARVYVTILIEEDFRRGFAQRLPHFRLSKPHAALIEAIPHVVLTARTWLASRLVRPSDARDIAAMEADRRRVQRGVECLKALDDTLQAQGLTHLIYLSPDLANLQGLTPRDTMIAGMIERAGVHVQWLQDRQDLAGLESAQVALLYHDGVHLSRRGHALWASILRKDLTAIGVGGPPGVGPARLPSGRAIARAAVGSARGDRCAPQPPATSPAASAPPTD